MREILFRGKRKIDNRWIEGNFITDEQELSKAYIGYLFGVDDDGTVHDTDVTEVDPETVCQWTGLTDKDGRKIFDGDILRFEDCSNYPVVWDSDYCAFGSCWYSDFDHLSKYRSIKIEVVGNIFDNPELLENED